MGWIDECDPAELDRAFRERIGFPAGVPLVRGNVDEFLLRAGRSIPFENLAVPDPDYPEISPGWLVEKMLTRDEGGLCYEINPLLGMVLHANGIETQVVRASVADPPDGWSPLRRTHVTCLVRFGGEWGIADAGFGVKQPGGVVPLSGGAVETPHGRYRVAQDVLGVPHMLQIERPTGWENAFGFDPDDIVATTAGLDEVRELIAHREESRFNKGTLMSLMTPQGRIVLTDRGLTEWRNGRKNVLRLEPGEVAAVAKTFFRRFAPADDTGDGLRGE